jgi:hypothetical protein
MSLTPHSYSTEQKPFIGYLGLMTLFTALVGSAISRSRSAERKPFTPLELILLGIATHKLSRVATRDRITSPLRAPFTRYEGSAGFGEVEEAPLEDGEKKAIGELVSCPYCASAWIAAPLVLAMSRWRGPTRMLCAIFSAVTLSHFLHQFYRILAEKK